MQNSQHTSILHNGVLSAQIPGRFSIFYLLSLRKAESVCKEQSVVAGGAE